MSEPVDPGRTKLPQACHVLAGPDTRAALTYRGAMTTRRRVLRRERATPLLIGAILVGLLLGASASIPAAAVQNDTDSAVSVRQSTGTLDWRSCGSRLECATLTVPKDYANPALGSFSLALSRVPARGDRVGSLVINPGGPGVAGIDFAAFVAGALPASVSSAYDIVAFDTRGAGKSAPVTCLTGRQTTRWLRADPTPDTRAERRDYMRLAARISAGCLQLSPGRAPYVSSAATVADMDSIRAALGEETLNWLGFSYGTYLGALYAEKYPDRVGRMVLDGAVDPSLDAMGISEGQSRGFQGALRRFAQDCVTHVNCPSTRSSTRVLTGINRLLERLDVTPMRTDGALPLNEAQAVTALFFAMYTPDRWPVLRRALTAADRGNGSLLQSMAEIASDQTGPATYGSNMASAFYAISCLDVPAPPRADGLARSAATWSRTAPVPALARAMSWGNAPCTSWFEHGSRRGPVISTTQAPILIVGTTGDPATPYGWSVELSRQLSTSRLLTFRGEGHTAVASYNNCIDSSVAEYLASGTLPAVGKVCS